MKKNLIIQLIFFLAAIVAFGMAYRVEPAICLFVSVMFAGFLLREFTSAWRNQELEETIAELKTQTIATNSRLDALIKRLPPEEEGAQQLTSGKTE